MEIRLRALSPEVEIAWRGQLRAADEWNTALPRHDMPKTELRLKAKAKLLASIHSANRFDATPRLHYECLPVWDQVWHIEWTTQTAPPRQCIQGDGIASYRRRGCP